MLKNFFGKIWTEALLHNIDNIISLLDEDSKANVLEIGCGDGKFTVRYKAKIGCKKITGTDGVGGRLDAAKAMGVDKIILFNLEQKWPLRSNTYDVVISNQVIEHILNLDLFISETYRILKPGGYCIVSTENLSSWHNVFALVLGYQDFSHHMIMKRHVVNPLSPHHNERTCTWSAKDNSGVDDSAFPHIKIPTYKSLRKIFEAYDFKFIAGKGSGYYPLFNHSSFLASKVDPYHSHFITLKLQKPL